MNRKKHFATLVSTLLVGVLAFSCSNAKDPVEPDKLTVEGIAHELTIPYDQTEKISFTVTSNISWSISKSNLDWISISPMSGGAGSAVEVSLIPKANDGDARMGSIKIMAGEKNESITIAQQAAPLIPSVVVMGAGEEYKIELPFANPSPVKLTVNGNVDWTAKSENLSWAVVAPVSGQAGKDVEVTITPEANKGAERTGTVTFSGEGASRTVTFVQAEYVEAPYLTLAGLTNDKLTFDAVPAAASKFTVNANRDWTISVPANTWLTFSKLSGKAADGTSTEISVTAQANSGEAREIEMTVTADQLKVKATIVQNAASGVQVFFEDDFAWSGSVFADGATDTTVEDFSVAANYIGAGVMFPKRSDLEGSTTSVGSNQYESKNGSFFVRGCNRPGYVRFTTGGSGSRYTTPFLTGIGTTPTDVTMTFRALAGPNNAGVKVDYTDAEGTTVDVSTFDIGSGDWTATPFQTWYKVTCNIKGLTSTTRINIRSTQSCTWFLDDVKIATFDSSAIEGAVMEEAPQVAVPTSSTFAAIAAEGASLSLIVNHNIPFTVVVPEWITYTASSVPFSTGSQTTVTLNVSANKETSPREGEVKIVNVATGTTSIVEVAQMAGSLTGVTFPVAFSTMVTFAADGTTLEGSTANTNSPDWGTTGVMMADAPNSSATGKWNVVNDPAASSSYTPTYIVSGFQNSTSNTDPGQYAIKPVWSGDNLTFSFPVANIAAGTKINMKLGIRGVTSCPRYFAVEYLDGSEWKPVSAYTTYTYAADNTTHQAHAELTAQNQVVYVDQTMTVSTAIASGTISMRLRTVDGGCMISGKAQVAKPGSAATLRVIGYYNGLDDTDPANNKIYFSIK